MLKIAICDDEVLQRRILINMISRIFNSNSITYSIDEFNNGEELTASPNSFDIYFLDIKMKQLTGIETAKRIRQTNDRAEIIFVTVLKEYVFDAFDVRAFHYILKPIDEEKLKKIVLLLLEKIHKKNKFIIAKNMHQTIKIFLQDIVYIEAQLRKIIVHTKEDSIEYYHKLTDIEEELENYYFFRCHKSYIVNLRYVHSYDHKSITLKNSKQIYLSKYKYTDFSKAFMYYLKSGE